MLGCPKSDGVAFNVAVYNETVRDMVQRNESHHQFEDHWADTHLYKVFAATEQEARVIAGEHFPSDQGFIIADITATH
ncbi:MAG: hypothetical protein ACPGO3_10660 [Magnetospiraceae bacterium]